LVRACYDGSLPVTQTPSTHPTSTVPDTVPGLETDAEGARIVREELKLLATVLLALDAAATSDASAAKTKSFDDERLLELRDDVAVAKPEDLPALFEQMHTLGALRAQRGRSVSGSVDRASPYFGHLRLEEHLDDAGNGPMPRPGSRPKPAVRRRDVLVGSRSYVDSTEGIRIVDWRNAPVSRIYYRYAEGDDYEEELGNRVVDGVVIARRGVTIVAGKLVRVAAPQGTFVLRPDGQWKRMGERAARLETEKRWTAQRGNAGDARLGIGADGQGRQDKHLPAIASLLDQKQFDLIARDGTGLVAIQGSAGSGKTTVGLHRVAYLAFRDPTRFRADKMFVVVPNEALRHYVGRVLPELGVPGVAVSTFARFAARIAVHLFPKLPSRISEETPPVVSRAKAHPAMLRSIGALAARVTQSVDTRLAVFADRWSGGSLLLDAWRATAGDRAEGVDAAPDARIAVLSQWAAGRRSLPGVTACASLPEVTRSGIEPLLAECRHQTRSVAAFWDEVLTSREALNESFAGVAGFGPMQLDLVHAWCVRQARVRAEGERDGEGPTLDAEDLPLLLRCWQALRGALLDPDGRPIRLAHVFVDEVQDAGPVELRVLLDLTGKERCVTLAGDVAQRLDRVEGEDRGEFDWNALLDDLNVSHTTIEPLKVSYRSTAEITEFARAVLGPLAHDEVPATTRNGPPVELFTFGSQGEAVAWLAEALKQLARDEPDANVALIARFPQQAAGYYEGLVRAEVPNVRRVAKQDFSWDAGVDVTDVMQTKGLEFDEVVLLETTASGYPVAAAARHALYVGATRASHQLWCIASETPSELVTAAIAPPVDVGGEYT
jgi:DNA helicase-2/ATP-dependent DNA helicase PcrA